MPGGDKTGPAGAGPMTGRGAGYCAGFTQPGCANPYVPGRRGRMGGGFGRGGGRGHGGGRFWAQQSEFMQAPPYSQAPNAPVPDQRDQAALLRREAKQLQEYLASIQARIDELKNNK